MMMHNGNEKFMKRYLPFSILEMASQGVKKHFNFLLIIWYGFDDDDFVGDTKLGDWKQQQEVPG